MWIYDAQTLRFLAVNDAAVEKYGYTREQFLALSLHDIRSEEESGALTQALDALGNADHRAGAVFEHRTRTGETLAVEIRSSAVQFEGRGARLVIARDVTRLARLESERSLLVRRERQSREAAETSAQLFRTVFEALPGKFLVLTPADYRLVAASNAYLAATMTKRADLEGRRLFDVFPDDPLDPSADGEHALRASLLRVEASGATDIMAVQRYPVRRPDGTFEERFWSPVNTPVRSPDGKIQYIVHCVEDVTEFVRSPGVHAAAQGPGERHDLLAMDIVLRTRELKRANLLLEQRDVLLRSAQRLIDMGTWDLDLSGESLRWTENVFRIHGLDPALFEPSMAAAMSCVHPEDVGEVEKAHRLVLARQGHMDITHRIVRPDGRERVVRQVAEIVRTPTEEKLVGVVQDITDQRNAARQAQAAFDLLRIAGRVAAVGGWSFEARQRVLQWSPETCAIHDEPEGTQPSIERAAAYFTGPGRERIRTAFLQCLAQGTPFDEQATIRTAKGRTACVRIIGEARRDAAGAIVGVHGALQDVTEVAAAREELLLLKSAVDRQSDILLITQADPLDGPEGPRIVYVNDAFVRRTGYARDEVIGRTPRLLQGPKTSRAELDRIRRALEARRPVRAELINYTRSGSELWLELDITPVSDVEGRVTHFVAVERDVTERKASEQRARVSEERFHLLARATNDVVWDWDMTTDALWWNEAFEIFFGYDRAAADPGSASWKDHIHPEDRARVVAGIHEVIDGCGTHWADEYRFLTADGEVLEIIDRGIVMRDESGQALRMIGSMVDVTELRRLEAQLRRTQRLDALGQLTGGLAHDFNNLLTVILGNAEILEEELAADPRLKVLAETTLHAAVRGAELTSRLLAFARKQALRPTPTDVNALIASLTALLERTLGENVQVQAVPQEGLWPALVDAAQLEAAILNLCINARDAMPAGGRLMLETSNFRLERDEPPFGGDDGAAAGDYVLIRVTDTGEGMDEGTLSRAFEPFFTTKEVGKGSGLGLSMVYGFARQSHGYVRIESRAGHGTTVRLAIPRAAQTQAHAPARTGAAVEGGQESVLLVEDNDLVQQHVRAQLASLGYRVHAVSNGSEALDELSRRHYDLLFTDIVMPAGIDGWELAARARGLRPGMAVLFTSGFAENGQHPPAACESAHLLKKPYRRTELAEHVRKAIDGMRATRAGREQ